MSEQRRRLTVTSCVHVPSLVPLNLFAHVLLGCVFEFLKAPASKEKVSQNQSRLWSLEQISLQSLKNGPFFPRVIGVNKTGTNTYESSFISTGVFFCGRQHAF